MEFLGILFIICIMVGGSLGARVATLHHFVTLFLSGFMTGVIVSRVVFFKQRVDLLVDVFESTGPIDLIENIHDMMTFSGPEVLTGIVLGISALVLHKFSVVILTSLFGAVMIAGAFHNMAIAFLLFPLGLLYQYKILHYDYSSYLDAVERKTGYHARNTPR